jgi:hypothetical protein
MESICHESQGVNEQADNQLKEEEAGVDPQHHADAGCFGPRHGCDSGARQADRLRLRKYQVEGVVAAELVFKMEVRCGALLEY